MTIQEFIEKADREKGFFSCTFVKKTTGELRTMVCRRGVKKGATGAPGPNGSEARPAQDKRCDVLTVYDVVAARKTKNPKASYRRINLDGLLYVTIDKQKYEYNVESQCLTSVE